MTGVPLVRARKLHPPDQPPDPLLVVVLGPTASGKTALALRIAQEFGGEIINCDSVAMYRGFDIGSAKPSAEEMARVPHHLFSSADPREEVTAGEYARQAEEHFGFPADPDAAVLQPIENAARRVRR